MRAAVGFLTSIPVGAAPPTRTTAAWFPLTGAVVGLLVGAAWWGAAEAFPPLVAAGLAVAVDLVLTGALHADGLADAADGLLGHLPDAARRKAVMAAPDVGAFGIAAVAVVLLVRWSALASIEPDVLLVVALWCASRSVMALALARLPYVGGGLGSAFAGGAVVPAVVGVVAAAVAAPAEVGGLILAAVGVAVLARRRIGGVTGDVLGALGMLGETVGLVLATATW